MGENGNTGFADGMLLDERVCLTMVELCQATGLHAEAVLSIVAEGVIEPLGQTPRDWRFTAESLARLKTVMRLQRDLDVNLAGAALVLDLLDEVDSLRDQLDALRHQLDKLQR